MIRGIFFDLYGTLFLYGDMKKAWTVWLNTFYSCLSDLGLKMSKKDFSNACDQFFGREEPAVINKDLTLLENRIIDLALAEELEVSINDVISTADIMVESWQKFIEPDPDAVPTLERLNSNFTLGLVSNFDHPRHVRKYLEKYNLDGFFDTIVVSAEVGVKKPDPEIFVRALEETGLDAADIVYVGDTEDDILAAEAANMKPVLIQRLVRGTDETALDFTVGKNRETGKERNSTNIISGLPELVSLVKTL